MADSSKARERQFEAFAAAVAEVVAWERGVGHEWDCDCIIDVGTLADLVRLAFAAPAKDREAFLASLAEEA